MAKGQLTITLLLVLATWTYFDDDNEAVVAKNGSASVCCSDGHQAPVDGPCHPPAGRGEEQPTGAKKPSLL